MGRALMAAAHLRELRHRAEDVLGVPRRLHDYQWEGVAFLYRSRAALLADEMGLGKTVQTAVALALLLSARNEMNRALIVAPAALTTNWMSELATWAPWLTVRRVAGDPDDRRAFYLLPIPVLVSSYEQIRQDGLDRIPSRTFDIVILDEAQRIKNRHSTTALACRLLPRKCSWALSATPLENNVRDVSSILGFLDPTIPLDLSGRRLSARLETMMLRRRKAEVRGELPPVIVQDLKIDWGSGKNFIGFTSAVELAKLKDAGEQRAVAEAVLSSGLGSKEVRQVAQLRSRSGRDIEVCIHEVLDMRPKIEKRFVFVGSVASEHVETLEGLAQSVRDAILTSGIEAIGLRSATGRLGPRFFTLVGNERFDSSMREIGKETIEAQIQAHIAEAIENAAPFC